LSGPYALTPGAVRGTPGAAFDLVATVTATQARIRGSRRGLGPEHFSVLQLAQVPTTVVDIASDIDLPLGVVRIPPRRTCAKLGLVMISGGRFR